MPAYPHEITVICPDSLRANGNHAIASFGLGPDDLDTLGAPQFEKGATKFRVTNTRITQQIYDMLVSPPQGWEVPRPEWDEDELINLQAARGVFNGRVVVVSDDIDGDPSDPDYESPLATLSTTKMTLVLDVPLPRIFAETGLTQIPQEMGI